MKRNIRFLLTTLSAISVWSITGCDDLLDKTSRTSLSASSIFETQSRIEGQVNGIYKLLKSSSLYGGRIHLYLDVRGEDFINVTGNTYTAYESWTNSYNSGSNDISNLWNAAYQVINNTNILIDGLEKLEGVIPEKQKMQYVAEAKFVRALAYYTLVTVFAPPYNQDSGASKAIPLRLDPETSGHNNDLARSTVKTIYDQILSDLDYSETSLPESYETALLNTIRAHRNTAISLKTRIYLNSGQYDKVIEEAKKIVPQADAPFSATSGVAHSLQEDILTIFNSSYTTNESVFSMPMTASDSYSGQASIGYIYYGNREYYLNPDGIVNDGLWGSTDARRDLLSLNENKYYLKKYAKASPYVDYIPVIRYAEVLLNYAEALAQRDNLSLAEKLLKAVHARSDADYVFPSGALDTKDHLLASIWKERRIELLGEGFRSGDLLRLLLPLPAKGGGGLQTGEIQPTAANYIFPYPNSEINANKLLLD
ncbi:MAG: RagB/SusD family nutrient uptake outer membrane protein [Tannerella sp.]|jgi:hypothetical protein|nr:RagB/SusD family nutrient uptake outer membrane protein [Tannerella sp.]